MKKSMFWFSISILVLILIVSCSDDVNKMLLSGSQTRVEYSKCTGCYECITEFDCPENAIVKDPVTNELTVFIDIEKCTNCMKCVNLFNCPENAITTNLDLVAPGEIENFNAVSDSAGLLELTFTAPGDDCTNGLVYSYDLQLFDAEENVVSYVFEFPLLLKEAGETENWLISGLTPDEMITVQLKAMDEVGQNSAPVSASVLIADIYVDIFPPSQINDLSAESLEEQIILTWTATGDDEMEGYSTGYEIRYSESEITDASWNNAVLIEQDIEPVASGEQESISIMEVPLQTDYYFAVKAFDSEGNYSAVSNNAEASIIGDITAPASITDLSVSDVSPESIMLSWTAVGDNELEGSAAAYIVKASQIEITEENWEDIPEYIQSLTPQPAGNAETLNIEDLLPLTTYYFAIKAVDESENFSNLSNIVYDTTTDVPDFTPPAEVDDLSAAADFTSVVLNWTATGDDGYEGTAYQYIIKISEEMITAENWDDAEILPDPPNPQQAGTMQSYLVTDLQPETDYYFALKVLDAAENSSGISNVAQAVLLQDTIAPDTISDLSVYSGNAYSNSTIRIDWTASGDDGMSGTASYCEVRTSSSQITEANWNSSELAVVVTDPEAGGSSETLNVTGLENGEVIYFAIKVFDDSGNSSSVSNSVWGKIVYTIYTGPCNGCGNCVYWCPEDAITDHGSWASIDYEQCDGCGTCDNYCPRGAIFRYVINCW